MKLNDQTSITGLLDDGIPLMPLNKLQHDQIREYNARLANGTYKTMLHEVCLICGGSSGTVVARKDRYGIAQQTVVCDDCGLVFTLDPLDPDSLSKFYTEQYRPLYDGRLRDSTEHQTYNDARFEERAVLAGQFLALVEKHAPGFSPRTVIEIGTGGGWNLSGFPQKGIQAIGYDYDIEEMRFGKDHGLDLRYGNIDTAINDRVTGDLVLMIQFLEHASDPVDTLKKAAALLGEGGILLVGVPGLRSLLFGHWGDKLGGTLQNAHLSLFEISTLQRAARIAGLEMIFGTEGLTALFCKRAGLPELAPDAEKRGKKVLSYLALTEKTAKLWALFWTLCGGPGTPRANFVRRITMAVARRSGFNV